MKNIDFGRKLRLLRTKEGMTQQELGLEITNKKSSLQRNKSDISKWENGTRTPDYETILDLEDIFSTPGVLQRAAGYEVIINEKSTSIEQAEHSAKLLKVGTRLLANNLNRISKWVNPEGHVEYLLFDEDEINIIERLTDDDLSSKLEENLLVVYRDYTEWFYKECFLPHLFAEWTEEDRNIMAKALIYEHPYKLIETLRLVIERKTFKGTCQVCKDWALP